MKNKKTLLLLTGAASLSAFALWTLALRFVSVSPIGPNGSSVGFSKLNLAIHNLTGVHMGLYTLTDWLGLIPIAFALGFAVLGLTQLIKRKSFLKVDRSILVLGGFYIAVIAAYLFFEKVVVNYRPVLINGVLEASYPSSTTMLSLCVMTTAVIELGSRIKNKTAKLVTSLVLGSFTAFMAVGRLISGVHWFSDIVGGALLSLGLCAFYCALRSSKKDKR